MQLLDYLSAPMPFLVGLPRAMMPALEAIRGSLEDEIVWVDLDKKSVNLTGFAQSPLELLPAAPLARLRQRLQVRAESRPVAPQMADLHPRHLRPRAGAGVGSGWVGWRQLGGLDARFGSGIYNIISYRKCILQVHHVFLDKYIMYSSF